MHLVLGPPDWSVILTAGFAGEKGTNAGGKEIVSCLRSILSLVSVERYNAVIVLVTVPQEKERVLYRDDDRDES